MEVTESAINIISEKTRMEGKIQFDQVCRVHGILMGEVIANPGSILILAETSGVEGTITADQVLIDGFVQGEIHAQTRVIISGTGRVVGNIYSPAVKIEPGAYFEGKCISDRKMLPKSIFDADTTE